MSDPLEHAPALSPEEWAKALRCPPGVIYGFEGDEGEMSRHRMAAMCLYGIPEGFTHADARLLRSLAHGMRAPRLNNLASRIEALLPPLVSPDTK